MRIIINVELFTCNDNNYGLADTCLVSNQIVRLLAPKAKCFYWVHKYSSFNICYYTYVFCKFLKVISSLQYSILIGYWNFFSWWTKFLIVLIFITFNDWVCVVFGPFPAWRVETKNRDPIGVNSQHANGLQAQSERWTNRRRKNT